MFLEAAIDGLPRALHATMKLKHPAEGRRYEDLLKSARDPQGREAGRAEGRLAPPRARRVGAPSSPSKAATCGTIAANRATSSGSVLRGRTRRSAAPKRRTRRSPQAKAPR